MTILSHTRDSNPSNHHQCPPNQTLLTLYITAQEGRFKTWCFFTLYEGAFWSCSSHITILNAQPPVCYFHQDYASGPCFLKLPHASLLQPCIFVGASCLVLFWMLCDEAKNDSPQPTNFSYKVRCLKNLSDNIKWRQRKDRLVRNTWGRRRKYFLSQACWLW